MILQMIFTLLDTQACSAPGCGARLSQGWGSALQSVAKLASLFLLWLPPSHNVDVSGGSGEGGAGTWERVLMVYGHVSLLLSREL